jgi:dimethylamine/trimethylamine dehydrogenase
MTNELPLVHQALSRRDIPVTTLTRLAAFDGSEATLAHMFSGEETRIPCRSIVLVGLRHPHDELHEALAARAADLAAAGIKSVDRIGDALAPGAIVHAVHSGHKLARELGEAASAQPYRRDTPIVDAAGGYDGREAAE